MIPFDPKELYGSFYYRIVIVEARHSPTDPPREKTHWVYADRFEIAPSGGLVMIGHPKGDETKERMLAAFAPGVWKAVYLSSILSGDWVAEMEIAG